MKPIKRVPMLGGRIHLANFTRYDTSDIAHLFEAIYAYRLKADKWPLRAEHSMNNPEISISYSTGRTDSYARRVGQSYSSNGIRVRHPDRLINNPIEALSSPRLTHAPQVLVLELIDAIGMMEFGRINNAGVRDILSITNPIRINEKADQSRPKGYFDRGWAVRKTRGAMRRAYWRAVSSHLSQERMRKQLGILHRYAAVLDLPLEGLSDIEARSRALEVQLRDLRTDAARFSTQIDDHLEKSYGTL